MAIKFYESPFHAIEEPEVASKSVLKADLTIMIRDIIENSDRYYINEIDKIIGCLQAILSLYLTEV